MAGGSKTTYRLRAAKKQWSNSPSIPSKTFSLWRSDGEESQAEICLCTFTKSGNSCVFTDETGELHEFSIANSVYKHIFTVGVASCLTAGLNRDSEILVGLIDGTIKCVDVKMQKLVGSCQLLDNPIVSISPAENRMEALVCGKDCAVIVKLDTFEAVRRLQVANGEGFVNAFYLPTSITAVFRDGSINAWNERYEAIENDKVPQGFVCLTASVCGSEIILAGESSHAFVYDLASLQSRRILQLPGRVSGVQKLGCVRRNSEGSAVLPTALSVEKEFIVFDPISSSLLFSSDSDAVVEDFSVGIGSIILLDKGKLILIDAEPFFEKGKKVISDFTNKVSEEKKEALSMVPKSHPFKIPPQIETARLLTILQEFMEYPPKYRTCIWHILLSLPLNFDAYASILRRGMHPTFKSIDNKYQFEDKRFVHNFKIVLSALSHWCNLFSEWKSLPAFCFPFMKSFHMRPMLCFEIVATILLNWGGRWFELFPSPPVNFLAMIENLIYHYDVKLADHFTRCKVTSEVYAWNPMRAALSEIFTTEDWFIIWDHIFSNPPAYLPCLLAAYCLVNRAAILSCKTDSDLRLYFGTRNPVILKDLIKKASEIMESAPGDIHPKNYTDDFLPLSTGQYPVFTKFPKSVITFKAAERDRIIEREKELQREKERNMELDKEIERLRMNENLTRARMQMIEATELSREMEMRNMDEEEDRIEEEFKKLSLYMSKKEEQLFQATQNKILMENSARLSDRVLQLEYRLREKKKREDIQQQAALAQLEKSYRELNAKKRLLELQLENLVIDSSPSSSAGSSSRTEHLDDWNRVMTNLDRLKSNVNADLLSAAVKEVDHIRVAESQGEISAVCEKIGKIEKDTKELMAKLTRAQSRDLGEKIRILQSIKAKREPQVPGRWQQGMQGLSHESPLSVRDRIASKYL